VFLIGLVRARLGGVVRESHALVCGLGKWGKWGNVQFVLRFPGFGSREGNGRKWWEEIGRKWEQFELNGGGNGDRKWTGNGDGNGEMGTA